jgi:hypothetical protein
MTRFNEAPDKPDGLARIIPPAFDNGFGGGYRAAIGPMGRR